MTTKKRCQSCGTTISPDFFGTNADNTKNPVFCKFCFVGGCFTEPKMTLDQMIGTSVDNMTHSQGLNYREALSRASEVIPKLARWS